MFLDTGTERSCPACRDSDTLPTVMFRYVQNIYHHEVVCSCVLSRVDQLISYDLVSKDAGAPFLGTPFPDPLSREYDIVYSIL